MAADTSRTAARKAKTPQPTLIINGPDTLIGYPVDSRVAVAARKPADKATTIVNAMGGVISAAGIGFLIAGATSEPPKTEYGGLRNLVLGFYGLVLLGLGIPLLFFQGKNGRLRQLRQARKAAEAPAPGASPAVDQKPANKRSTGGLVLVLLGALCMSSLVIPSFLAFLLVPIGLICLVIGLVSILLGEVDF
ncbi:hypothetical protein [Hymenobacter rigui]|uniref:Uncharacterized protein n=1 Tax=Hymenobacter rigui TaxID=334424 RepID=A0A3R9N418_9BACT|nr:hypothetical protein [Hymenobacter rigui]RSK47712.1 hypothetical protein EI291_14000 [Hymenobacter rigui]